MAHLQTPIWIITRFYGGGREIPLKTLALAMGSHWLLTILDASFLILVEKRLPTPMQVGAKWTWSPLFISCLAKMSSVSHSCQNCEGKASDMHGLHNYSHCKVILEWLLSVIHLRLFCFKATLVIHCSHHVVSHHSHRFPFSHHPLILFAPSPAK